MKRNETHHYCCQVLPRRRRHDARLVYRIMNPSEIDWLARERIQQQMKSGKTFYHFNITEKCDKIDLQMAEQVIIFIFGI